MPYRPETPKPYKSSAEMVEERKDSTKEAMRLVKRMRAQDSERATPIPEAPETVPLITVPGPTPLGTTPLDPSTPVTSAEDREKSGKIGLSGSPDTESNRALKESARSDTPVAGPSETGGQS